jgi:hypothetical protein
VTDRGPGATSNPGNRSHINYRKWASEPPRGFCRMQPSRGACLPPSMDQISLISIDSVYRGNPSMPTHRQVDSLLLADWALSGARYLCRRRCRRRYRCARLHHDPDRRDRPLFQWCDDRAAAFAAGCDAMSEQPRPWSASIKDRWARARPRCRSSRAYRQQLGCPSPPVWRIHIRLIDPAFVPIGYCGHQLVESSSVY